jgi:Histone methylation protein DOT1
LTQSITSTTTTNTNTTTRDNNYNDVVTFVQGDAASGPVVGPFLANATVVWISNLLFDEALNQALVRVIQEYAGPNLRVIASLKPLVRASSTKTTLSTTRNDSSINNGGGESIKGFEMQSFKVPFEMSWTAGIHNQQQDEYDHNHEAVSSPSPGHYCSILLRRRRQQ